MAEMELKFNDALKRLDEMTSSNRYLEKELISCQQEIVALKAKNYKLQEEIDNLRLICSNASASAAEPWRNEIEDFKTEMNNGMNDIMLEISKLSAEMAKLKKTKVSNMKDGMGEVTPTQKEYRQRLLAALLHDQPKPQNLDTKPQPEPEALVLKSQPHSHELIKTQPQPQKMDTKTKSQSQNMDTKTQPQSQNLDMETQSQSQKLDTKTQPLSQDQQEDKLNPKLQQQPSSSQRRKQRRKENKQREIEAITAPATTQTILFSSSSAGAMPSSIKDSRNWNMSRKELLEESWFEIWTPCKKAVWPVGNTPVRLYNYSTLATPSPWIDQTTGTYTTPVKGRYSFGGGVIGDIFCKEWCDVYVCMAGKRELVGTLKDLKCAYDHDVTWDCEKGERVWLECVWRTRVGTDIECGFFGHMLE